MKKTGYIISVCLVLLMLVGFSQAASISGSAGTVTLSDGPNTEGVSFEVDIHFEAFDGLDASDPLGVTPGKKQFAYIVEYKSGNEYVRFFDVESINGVPLLEAASSTNGTVNGVAPGTMAPLASVIVNLSSGNPAARFVYIIDGNGSLGLAGAKSTILVYTAGDEFNVGNVMGQIVDTSLSAVGEMSGPIECFSVVEGSVFCLECGPEGEIIPMEGVGVNIIKDSNIVETAVTDVSGKYQVAGIDPGDYTVAIDQTSGYFESCSVDSQDVTVGCEGVAVANFCVCPGPCVQSICVRVIDDSNGTEIPLKKVLVGLTGEGICKWRRTKADGIRCFDGPKIVAGSYKVKIKVPKGYDIVGDAYVEFDLAECESKEIVFHVVPEPPCEQTVCATVVELVDGNEVPVEGVNVKIKVCRKYEIITTDADGQGCITDLKPNRYTAVIEVPEGYRLCDNEKYISFCLKKCEQEDIKFVLCKKEHSVCPKKPDHWKCHSGSWPVEEMWLGEFWFEKAELMNLLNGKLADGSDASCRDVTVQLAKNLIAAKLSLAAGAAPKDIETVIIAADEFFLFDNPPGSRPRGATRELARELKNKLYQYVSDDSYCSD